MLEVAESASSKSYRQCIRRRRRNLVAPRNWKTCPYTSPAFSIYEWHQTKANIADNLKSHSFATARNALIETSPYSDILMRKSSNPDKDWPLLTHSWDFDFGMATSKMLELPLARKLMHNDALLKRKKLLWQLQNLRLQHHTDNVFEGDGEISSRHEAERPVLILYLHFQFTKDIRQRRTSQNTSNSIVLPQPEMHRLKKLLTATHWWESLRTL